MRRLLKLLVFLAILAFLALVIFAYLGDLRPASETVERPVTLDVD